MTLARMRSTSANPLHADDRSHVVVSTPRPEHVEARVPFVDLLRLVAAFQMLQGHTVAALLARTHRVGAWYALWSAARGLTSVAFLFAAGLAFYIATARDYTGHRQDPRAVRRRFRRGWMLVGLGYVLHAPLLALWSHDATLSAGAWRRFMAVDVLQCIGVSLLCLEVLVLRLSTPARLARACAALGVVLFGLAPVAAHLPLELAPRWLAAYLVADTGSLFPLLPWSAHVFLGVACAGFVMREPARVAMRLSLLAAALLIIAGALRWAHASPVLYDHVSRLAWVTLVSALLAGLSRRATRQPRWLTVLAGETLFLYVFHVLLVYGDGVGLSGRIGACLSPWAACAAAIALVSVSFVAAWGYHRLRVARRRQRVGVVRLAGTSWTR
jgi:hypothetical protein